MVGGRREGGREDEDRLLMRGWYHKGRCFSTGSINGSRNSDRRRGSGCCSGRG